MYGEKFNTESEQQVIRFLSKADGSKDLTEMSRRPWEFVCGSKAHLATGSLETVFWVKKQRVLKKNAPA